MSAATRLRCAELHETQQAAAALWSRAARMEVRLLDAEHCEGSDLTEVVLPLRAALAALNEAVTNLLRARTELAATITAEETRP